MCDSPGISTTPSPRTEQRACPTCGELLTLEMEFEPPFICVDCQADMAKLHEPKERISA